MPHQFKYIIVGGGLAGASAVEGIREHDRSGSIALFGKEDRLPYDRPPLSKGLWLGKSKLDQISVHDESFYKSRSAHVFLNTEIVEIESKKKTVADREGRRYIYDKLLIATGGTPRVLSFGEGAVHYYRTVEDYLFLKEAAERMEEFIFIGGGFIGAELAAALAVNKKKVTIVFPDNYLLQKVFPGELAKFVTEYYVKRGVTIVGGDIPTAVARAGGETTVMTKLGKKLSADMAVAAIGLNLHTDMFKRAGLKVDNGISVNALLQTSEPSIFAAGDLANFPAGALDRNIRIEHWDNAQAQGKHAGANMTGANKPYVYLPYFWSDLFDLGFEAVGDVDARLQTFADWREEFREGVVYYLDRGRVKGVLLWNVWERTDAARGLISRKKVYRDPAELKGML
jgi:NADPH-dependent 2,4-dienoyl-CoA reductase/sulfur reductase-like enzyme